MTGDVMPQNGRSYEGRRGGARHSTWGANYRVPFTGLVNGAVAHNGWPDAATESRPAGTMNGAKPPCVVNGDGDHWYKSTKAAPLVTLRKQGGTASAGGGRSAGDPRGIWAKVAAGRHVAASPCNSDQMAPQIIQSATAKNQRRRKTFKHKKRNKAACPENPPLMEEDWEKELQEVTLTDWEKNSYGIEPYGPQDVIHFSLRGLTLQQRDAVDLPVAACYSPSVHHSHPIPWRCFNVSTEKDQYADADD